MNRYKYSEEVPQVVKVKGIECEFFDERIELSSVPEGKIRYEVAGDDDSGAEPARVKKAILVNFYGTLVCEQKLPIGEDGVLWLEEGDFEYVYEL